LIGRGVVQKHRRRDSG